MENFDTIELIQLVPENVIENYNLTKKQTMLLGYFVMLNGLEESKTNGAFYRSNEDILEDLAGEITKPTLISSIRKLETVNLIERKSGYRNKDGKQASVYTLNENNIFNNQRKMNTTDLTLELVQIIKTMQEQINFQNKLIGKILDDENLTHNLTHKTPINTSTPEDMGKIQVKKLNENLTHNLTSDTDIDIEKEIDIIKNKINKNNNIIKENNINKNIIKKEKEIIINNNLEKEKDVESKVEAFTFNNEKENIEEGETKIEILSSNSNENIETFDEDKKTIFQENNKIEEPSFEDDEYDDTKKLNNIEASELLFNFYDTNKNDVTNEKEYKEFETVLEMKLNNLINNEQITNEQYQSIRTFVANQLLNNLRIKIYSTNTNWDKKPSLKSFNDTNLSSTQSNEETPSEALELANAPIVESIAHTQDTNEENTAALEKEYGAVFINPFTSFQNASNSPQNNDGASSTHTTQETRSEGLNNSNNDNVEESNALMKKLLSRAKTLFSEATTHQECKDTFDKVSSGIEKLKDEGKLAQSDYSNVKNKIWFAYTEKRSTLLQQK